MPEESLIRSGTACSERRVECKMSLKGGGFHDERKTIWICCCWTIRICSPPTPGPNTQDGPRHQLCLSPLDRSLLSHPLLSSEPQFCRRSNHVGKPGCRGRWLRSVENR